jgi:hypothetical protein
MLDKVSKSLVVRLGLLLAVVVAGAIAFSPPAQAESVCDQLTMSIVPPGPIATGSSFQVQWNVIPGAAGYEVSIEHEGGTLVYTDGVGSRTVSSNDIQGDSFTVTVKALTPEGDVLCSVSQGEGIYKEYQEEDEKKKKEPPERPQPADFDFVDDIGPVDFDLAGVAVGD